MNKHLTRFGLKWNPFLPDVPTEACFITPQIDNFCWRVEHLAKNGGFALITGEPGTGKSVAMRLLAKRLDLIPDMMIGILTRPHCSIADFYRELGALYGIHLSPSNRWAGAKVLRERWQTSIDSTLLRPVLLIDEAQEMRSVVLNELRLLSSAKLDSHTLLTVILCGDDRLPELFRSRDLLPLGSRIRVRLNLEPVLPNQLGELLNHAISQAGNSSFITKPLQDTLCERAIGNLRVLMNMGNDLLDAAIQKNLSLLDEKLFLEIYAHPHTTGKRAISKKRLS